MTAEFHQRYMTNNDCYKSGKSITPIGIMLHSTAAPGVMAAAWFDRWNKPGVEKCVHSFADDKSVWQYLPWTMRAWHCGSGPAGSGNNTHISIELCEPSGYTYQNGQITGYNTEKQTPYFNAVWQNARDLCVRLCQTYGLTEQNVICHSEGFTMGIASNHADVMQWFPLQGKNMDDFRRDVKKALEEPDMTQEQFNEMMDVYNQQVAALPVSTWAKESWEKYVSMGFFDGTQPRGALSREAAAVVLGRVMDYAAQNIPNVSS